MPDLDTGDTSLPRWQRRGVKLATALAVVLGTAILVAVLLFGQSDDDASGLVAMTPPTEASDSAEDTQAISAPEPAESAPEPVETDFVVGDIVDAGGFEVGLAGGQMIEDDDGWSFVALKVFVRNTSGIDMMGTDRDAFSLRRADGTIVDSDFMPIAANRLPDLSTFILDEGDSTAGWLAFRADSLSDAAVLIVSSELNYKVTKISLANLANPGPESAAVQAFEASMQSEAEAEDRSTVTMEEYEQVNDGMTLEQVQEIVGFDGDETSSSGGYTTRSWSNSDGSGMSITFYQNRVQAKAQFGL